MRSEKELGAMAKPESQPTNPATASTNQSHAQHSPLPWHVAEASSGGFFVDVRGDDSRLLAIAAKTGIRGEAEANAAFIVRAVNAHDDLVAALTQARREYGAFGRLSGEALVQMDAAIAKARR